MNRKTANIILGVFICIWIMFSLAVLLVLLFRGDMQNIGWEYIVQLLISLLISMWLGFRIWKYNKK